MAIQEQQLVDLLSAVDETVAVKAIERATQERQEKGLGKDIIDALAEEGIKVLTRPIEKPFYKSKKFWGGAIAFVILMADEYLKVGLWKAAAAPLGYIFGQGLADLGKNKG
jgi:hypothetical protein